MLTSLFENISLGLSTAFSPSNLLYCAVGVVLGNFIGVIPGIGALTAMSMLIPITFYLDPISALVMLGGIYYGSAYGGAAASILLNMPGTPANTVTCLDGHPMATQGRAGVALFMATISSFVGGSLGIIIMMLFSPIISEFALSFGAAEYFSLMVMGLIAASMISHGSLIKAIAMIVLGILFGLVGTDMYTGARRFTFGIVELVDGPNLAAVAMGLFAVSEIVASIRTAKIVDVDKRITVRSMLPTRDELTRSVMPALRGAGIGGVLGALPGAGGAVAAFMSYAAEKRIAKDPSRFGKGAIEGIVGPESANNAADQTAFIPTLTLGIPGSVTMALMLGVLTMQNIIPGPTLISEHPDLFWGLIMSFWIGNVLLVLLNVPMIGIWVRVLKIPPHILYPGILVFICVGAYTVNNNSFDVLIVIIFGALGYGMRILEFPAAPLLLGYVLGPMMEEHFRRAMILSRGSPEIFIDRPLSLAFLLFTTALIAWASFSAYSDGRRARATSRSA